VPGLLPRYERPVTECFFLPYANQDSTPHDRVGLRKALQDALVDFNPDTRAPPYDARYLGIVLELSPRPRPGKQPLTRPELWVATEQVLDPEVFDIALARSCNGIS
jgi:hypothetical protein